MCLLCQRINAEASAAGAEKVRVRWRQGSDGGRLSGGLVCHGRALSFILSETEPQEGSEMMTDMI